LRPENYFKGSSRVKRLRKASPDIIHKKELLENVITNNKFVPDD
jgi:hypothetical protein